MRSTFVIYIVILDRISASLESLHEKSRYVLSKIVGVSIKVSCSICHFARFNGIFAHNLIYHVIFNRNDLCDL